MPYNFNTITISTQTISRTGGMGNQWGGQVPNYGTMTYNPPQPRIATPNAGTITTSTQIPSQFKIAPGTQTATTTNAAYPNLKAADQKSIDEEHAGQQYEWETYHKANIEAASKQMQQAATDEMNRAIADAAARYGWQRSAGAGTAGMYEMGQYQLQSKMMQIRAEVAQMGAQYMLEAEQAWYNSEDKEAFNYQMARLNKKWQEELMSKQAELNDSSWWSKLGSVIGPIVAMMAGGIPTEYGVGDWVKGVGYRIS